MNGSWTCAVRESQEEALKTNSKDSEARQFSLYFIGTGYDSGSLGRNIHLGGPGKYNWIRLWQTWSGKPEALFTNAFF